MSTKIYNGFKLKGIPTLEEVFAWSDSLRRECTELAKEELARQIAREACRRHDAVALADLLNSWGIESLLGISQEELARPPLNGAYSMYWREVLEQSSSPHRNPDVDYDFSLILIPVKGKIVGLYDAEKEFYVEALLKHPRVESFSYWTTTDRPAGLSAEQWGERGDLWDAALPRSYSTSERGISISIVSGCGLLIRNDLKDIVRPDHLPTIEKRAEAITNRAHANISIKRLCRERGLDFNEIGHSLPMSLIAEAIYDTRGKDKILQQVLENLEEISLEDLRKPTATLDEPAVPAP